MVDLWKESFIFRTIVSSLFSFCIGIAFIIFNGVLGLWYHSIWYGTICIYYILLTAVRGIIVFFQRKDTYRHEEDGAAIRTRVSVCTHIVLLFLNLALIAPIAVMVKGERNYEFGLIPAIAFGVYTTYRVVFSIINLRKSKQEYNCLIRELRVINFLDTLVAVLSLQNALLIAEGSGIKNGYNELSAFTSAGIFALMVFITVRSMIVNSK